MAEEIRLFLRSGVYAGVVAIVYWFVSYDPIGTVLLAGFSLASWVAVGLLRRGQPPSRRSHEEVPPDAGSESHVRSAEHVAEAAVTAFSPRGIHQPQDIVDRPFLDESGRIPTGSGAPFLVGLGLGIAAMGAVFGLWFVIAGAIPFALGALDWLGDMMHEYEATERAD